ncbi:MAG: DMT family transporter, partial [Burkholderiaceae bacterium]|nr:DMT family transporter [Burkholderiaceae bacterium]
MSSAPATLFALGAVFLWSLLAALAVGLRAVPPFLLLGLSLTGAGLIAAPTLRRWRVPLATLALGVYGLFGFHLLLFIALRRAPAVEANLVNYLWPLLIVLLAPLLLRGLRLTARHVIAALLGFAGAALVISGGRWTLSIAHWDGYVLALGSALIWSTYSLLTRRVPPFPTAAVGLFCLVSGLLALGAHAALEPRYVPSAREWLLIGALALGPMGAAFFLWDAALKRGDARAIGALSFLTPLASTLLLIAT